MNEASKVLLFLESLLHTPEPTERVWKFYERRGASCILYGDKRLTIQAKGIFLFSSLKVLRV